MSFRPCLRLRRQVGRLEIRLLLRALLRLLRKHVGRRAGTGIPGRCVGSRQQRL
jgi:hypothetical protein